MIGIRELFAAQGGPLSWNTNRRLGRGHNSTQSGSSFATAVNNHIKFEAQTIQQNAIVRTRRINHAACSDVDPQDTHMGIVVAFGPFSSTKLYIFEPDPPRRKTTSILFRPIKATAPIPGTLLLRATVFVDSLKIQNHCSDTATTSTKYTRTQARTKSC